MVKSRKKTPLEKETIKSTNRFCAKSAFFIRNAPNSMPTPRERRARQTLSPWIADVATGRQRLVAPSLSSTRREAIPMSRCGLHAHVPLVDHVGADDDDDDATPPPRRRRCRIVCTDSPFSNCAHCFRSSTRSVFIRPCRQRPCAPCARPVGGRRPVFVCRAAASRHRRLPRLRRSAARCAVAAASRRR